MTDASELDKLRTRIAELEAALRYIVSHEQKPTRDVYEAAARQPLIDIARAALALKAGKGQE